MSYYMHGENKKLLNVPGHTNEGRTDFKYTI
jgi:hypothetical protein